MRPKIIGVVLWISFLLAMAASIHHLAWTFGTAEQKGMEWLGWIPAIGVDAGLAALAYTIQQRKRAQRKTIHLWIGVAGFAAISALANLYHAIAVASVNSPVLANLIGSFGAEIAKAVLLSGTLPVMYIFLGEIVSADDANEAERIRAETRKAEDDRARELARAERQARKDELEAERLLIEARAAAEAAKQSEAERIQCEKCGRLFSSVNGRNAHKCKPERIQAIEETERANGKAV